MNIVFFNSFKYHTTMEKAVARIPLAVSIVMLAIGIDQASKVFVRNTLHESRTLRMFGDAVLIHMAENRGAFLSLGAQWPPLLRIVVFILLPLTILMALLLVLIESEELGKKEIVGFCFIIGGGMSNIGERIFNDGLVTDFINVGIRDFRTGIFNIADFLVFLGVGLVLYTYISRLIRKRPA